MTKVRVGVAGTSWWADGMHLPALTSHEGAVAAAICGRDRARAEAMAAKHGVEKVYTDWRAMIGSGALDAVIISTPDALHHPIAMAAFDSGLHVLCEKPLGLDAHEAHEMLARSREAKRVTMTYFTWRWLKQTEHMKRLMEDGFAGAIQHAHFAFLAGGNRGGWRENWRYDARTGNGALGDLGSHMIDMARWMCGEISGVCAHLKSFTPPPADSGIPPANDSALLSVDFAGGAHGTIRASNVELVPRDGFEWTAKVSGEAGKLALRVDLDGATLLGRRGTESEMRALAVPPNMADGVDFTHGIVDQKRYIFSRHSVGVRGFIDAILGGRDAAPDFRDGWLAQVVMDAAIESDATGRRVALGG